MLDSPSSTNPDEPDDLLRTVLIESPRFTLRQLEVFLAVAQVGNVSRAAEQLHCSASAASSSITELERSLRTQLCVRKKSRGVVLTAQGRLLEELARRLLADAAVIGDVLDEGSVGVAGVLRLGVYPPLGASFLPALLQGFTELHPNVTVELHEGSQDDLAERLLAGDLDASLIYESPQSPDLELVHLLSRRPYVLVAADHRLAGAGSVSLAELAPEPLVLLDLPPSKHYTMRWFRECGVHPHVRWQTHDIELLRAMVGRGLGYAVILQRQQDPCALDGTPLRALEISPTPAPVEVYLATRRAPSTPRRVLAFMEFVRDQLVDPPAWTGAVGTDGRWTGTR